GSDPPGGPSPAQARVTWRTVAGSPHAVGQSRLHRRAGVERAQHGDRRDRGAGKLGRDIRGDAGETQHLDVEHLPGGARRFEIVAAVVTQAEIQALSRYRL